MRKRTVKYLTLLAALLLVGVSPLPAHATSTCGDADDNGVVTVSDALVVLQAAVNGAACEEWLCDTNDDGGFSVTDALLTLQRAVDDNVKLVCAEGVNPGDFDDGRLALSNDDVVLDLAVSIQQQLVPIDDSSSGSSSITVGNMGGPPVDAPVLTLVAEIDPPLVGGQVLQAVTAYRHKGNEDFIVSYMMVGAPHLGALDLISMRDPSRPVLKSRATFTDADAIDVASRGSLIYVAQASSDASLVFPAALERLKVIGNRFVPEDNLRVGLSSFAATSVTTQTDEVFVTTGNAGELSSLHFDTLVAEPVALALDDLRWARIYGDKIIAVQGTPGRLSIVDLDTLAVLATYPFAGADVAEAKTTVDVVGGKAFIAAGSAGLQVVSINTGQFLGSLSTPSVAGLDPSVVVTNAVAVADDLVFMSNGEGGVFVARNDQDFASTDSETPVNLTMLGQLQFGALQSANHVEYNGDFLVVTAGLGGVKVVTVND